MTKIGRNEKCPCGSGLKYKRCCEAQKGSPSWGTRLLAILVVAILAGGALLVFSNYDNDGRSVRRVWSADHGHWHEVPGP